MVDGVDEWLRHKTGQCQAGNIVEVDDVAIPRSIVHRPRRMVHILDAVEDLTFDGPLGLGIQALYRHRDGGLTIGIDDNVNAARLQAKGQRSDEQLRPPILRGWDGNERRRDETDSHW